MSDRNNTEVVPYTTTHGAGLNRHQISDFRRQMSDIRPQISDKRTNLADFRRPSPLYRGAGLAPAEKPRSKKESPLIRGRHIWRPPSNYSTIAKPSLNYCSATVHPSYPYRFSIACPRLLNRFSERIQCVPYAVLHGFSVVIPRTATSHPRNAWRQGEPPHPTR